MTSPSMLSDWHSWATRQVGADHWDRVLYLAGLIGLVGIGLSAFVPVASDLATFFSLTLLINGPYSPLLPVGYEPVLMTYGKLYTPLLIAAVGVTGQVLVEYVNYHLYAGALQSDLLIRMRTSRLVSWLVAWFNVNPFLAVVVAALTPLPFWAVRIAAPLAHYPVRRYLTATALGRFPRLWFYAAVGSLIPLNGALIFTGGLALSAVIAALLLHRHRRPAAVPIPDL